MISQDRHDIYVAFASWDEVHADRNTRGYEEKNKSDDPNAYLKATDDITIEPIPTSTAANRQDAVVYSRSLRWGASSSVVPSRKALDSYKDADIIIGPLSLKDLFESDQEVVIMLFLFGFVLRICIHAVRARKGDDQQNPPLNARYPELGEDSARIRKRNRHIWSKAEQAVRKTAKTKGHARQQPATKKVSPNGEKPRQRDFWASIPHKAGGGIPIITSSRLESRHAQVDLLDYLVRTLGADLSARVPMYTIWDAAYSRSNTTIYMKPTTALHAAALGQNEAVAQRLIELGADVNALNRDGASPLHYAAHNSATAPAVVRLLLEHGGKTETEDTYIAARHHNSK
ncbi:hypothetical protein CFD26_104879 [Aspergillus turcosus]|uniref:Uncharacterized protein n=1 Tax=Aspergillus turcosus TaxID=1245748 RepID=A0A3R7LWG3_9EURO|nr:hypothetical protein CFD26_104879 [Aspergillus turcosus]